MMVFAHQDDELPSAGVIQRLGPDSRFIWVTNGDGLAPFVGEDPKTYAETRKKETDNAMSTLGRKKEEWECLDSSEIENYDAFLDIRKGGAKAEERFDYFYELGCKVYHQVKDFNPDIVWTLAFQGGQPEHDLTHLLTALALKQFEQESGRKRLFIQIPEYEYIILVPLRFNPFYRGTRHNIDLSDEEFALKIKMARTYPSQDELLEKFQSVINSLGKILSLFGKKVNFRSYLGREQFGPVPASIDYSKSFHFFECANYINEKHKGEKITYRRHIAPIWENLRKRRFE